MKSTTRIKFDYQFNEPFLQVQLLTDDNDPDAKDEMLQRFFELANINGLKVVWPENIPGYASPQIRIRFAYAHGSSDQQWLDYIKINPDYIPTIDLKKRFEELEKLVFSLRDESSKGAYELGLANGALMAQGIVLNVSVDLFGELDATSLGKTDVVFNEVFKEKLNLIPVKKQIKDIRYRLEVLPQEARIKAFEYARKKHLKDELSFPASNTTDALDVILPEFTDKDQGENLYWIGIRKEADKEFNILHEMKEMCCQSLDPETFDKWEEVKEMLERNRKML